MQELFVDKIHSFKSVSMGDKSRLVQLKVCTVQAYLDLSMRTGKYPVLRTKSYQLIKHAKISYFIASIVFLKLSCGTYRNGLNRGTSRLKYLNSTNRGLIPFVGICILVCSCTGCRNSKTYLCL